MKLHEVITTAGALLKAKPELSGLKMISESFTHNEMEEALEEHGLAMVLVQESAEPTDSDSPVLELKNLLVVMVLENRKSNEEKNPDGPRALEVVGHVLTALHQQDLGNPGQRNSLTVDKLAYTRGELGRGVVSYFCNFVIKTIE